ncbi:hypothetical protein C8N47_111103 [Mangrovibacterium marinum]|uniref:Uncharacterized protein n=1 Tax=Mangrovibacterium marinum TaxID=1639118 RepID=A0A2T5C0L6_9BACT|nr:hypothetical protein [Mangrovibacterium marinum]PTN08063.1 hypothetical protein C8N47_111103 [Mangrovibacterium marinum]
MNEFIEKVARMRRMQNKYFSTKERHYLVASKEAEREVDDELKKLGKTVVSAEDRQEQQRLF